MKGDLDGAREDFLVAAQLGSLFAKQEAVKLNPLARLCNQMLGQAMKELQFV